MTVLPKPDSREAKEFFSRKLSFTVGPADVKKYLDEKTDFVLIDVRRAEDYAKEHIPGALNLPEGRWSSFAGLSKSQVNVLYCYTQQCHLAARAAVHFASAGYPVMEMEGGFQAWKDSGHGIERGESETRRTA